MFLKDEMPLAWRYQRTVVDSSGTTVVDTLDMLFLEHFSSYRISPVGRFSTMTIFPDSLRREVNTVSAWLAITVDGWAQLWFETDEGLFRSPYFRRDEPREMIATSYLVLPSDLSDRSRWPTSPDAGESIIDVYEGAFMGETCRIIETEWTHFPPYTTSEKYWSLGIGLLKQVDYSSDIEYSEPTPERRFEEIGRTLLSTTTFELIEFIPRSEPERITHLNVYYSGSNAGTLKLISELTYITSIGINGYRISEQVIPDLRNLENLEVLDFRKAGVTAEILMGLSDFTYLRELYLPEQFSESEVIAELRSALPNTIIHP